MASARAQEQAFQRAPLVRPGTTTDALVQLMALVTCLLPLVAALAVSFIVTPDDIESGRVVLSPPCTMKQTLGLPCPSCGLTRAFCALSHGDIATALDYHAQSLFVYGVWWFVTLVVAWLSLRAALTALRRGRSAV